MDQVGETELDLGALLAALWRKAWLLVLIGAGVAAATYFALSFVAPIYRADSRILIEVRESVLTRPREAVESFSNQFDESAIQSQVEVLLSRDIANRVIDELGLDRRPEFDPATQPSIVDNLLYLAGLQDTPTSSSIRQRAMQTYYDRLSVSPVGKSRVIAVEFDSPNPQLSADVANAVADAFIDLQSDAKRDATAVATVWLEKEIGELRQRVAEAEAAVEAYRSGSELFPSRTDADLTSQQLSDINAELARAKAARSEAEARAELVRRLLDDGGSLEAAEEVLSSPLIQRLRERQVTLTAQIAELSTTHLPSHPRIEGLRTQLVDMDRQIRREAEKVLQSLETAARVAAARQSALSESLNEAKAAASQANEESIELRALEREARSQRELLETFLGRYREAAARTDSGYLPPDARIISRAIAPLKPAFPKKTLLAAVAAIVALMLSAALIMTREFTSGRAFRIVGTAPARRPLAAPQKVYREPEFASDLLADTDFEREVAGDPALPSVTPQPQDPPGTVEVAEALAEDDVRVALFVGAEGGEGAGEIAMAAARLAAAKGVSLVLLDVGVTPSEALGGGVGAGLGDLLSGKASFGETIRHDEDSPVHFIPMGSAEGDPPMQRLSMVIGALIHSYDKVVIVADALGDWPDEQVQPDLAAIVCAPDLDQVGRHAAYDRALEQGARSALIIRRVPEDDVADEPDMAEERDAAA